jgi:hypothetical protein
VKASEAARRVRGAAESLENEGYELTAAQMREIAAAIESGFEPEEGEVYYPCPHCKGGRMPATEECHRRDRRFGR